MAFFKALIPGALLTFVVAMVLGINHMRGGVLMVHRVMIDGQDFYWSWPLFVVGTGLAWAIIAMTPR
jgi:hypothetical protein